MDLEKLHSERTAHFILRLGLAFAFLFPAMDAIFDSASWIGYLPHFVRGIAPDLVILHAFGALEAVLALWILSGKKIQIPSALMFIILLVIVGLNLSQFEIIFRDLAIAAIALALVFWPNTSNRKVGHGEKSSELFPEKSVE